MAEGSVVVVVETTTREERRRRERRRQQSAPRPPRVTNRRRERILRTRRLRKLRRRLVVFGLPVLALVLWLRLAASLGVGANTRPDLMPPERFDGVVALSSTDSVGTLFRATLRARPATSDDLKFHQQVHEMLAMLANGGYESFVLLTPDGTTLAWGAVHAPEFSPPGARGT